MGDDSGERAAVGGPPGAVVALVIAGSVPYTPPKPLGRVDLGVVDPTFVGFPVVWLWVVSVVDSMAATVVPERARCLRASAGPADRLAKMATTRHHATIENTGRATKGWNRRIESQATGRSHRLRCHASHRAAGL